MRKLFFAAAALFFACAGFAAQSAADKLFDGGKYAEAKTLYSAVKPDGSDNYYRALYRETECEGLLFSFQTAFESAEKIPLPSDPLWRARFLLLKAEAARNYMVRYNGRMTEEKIENPSAAQLTPDELRAKAAAYYGALFALRAKLEAEPLSEESYFVEFKKNQLAETPTLWDFALSRWISFFAERADSSVDADSYLLAAPSCEAGKDAAPALTALRLASCGELGGGTLRAQARELWRVKRLLMPFNQGGLNVSSTTAHAVAQKLESGRFEFADARQRALRGAAGIYERSGELEHAVALYKKAEAVMPDTDEAKLSRAARAAIEMPALSVVSGRNDSGLNAVTVSAKNVPYVYFRLYAVSQSQLCPAGSRRTGWNCLRQANDSALSIVSGMRPRAQWREKIAYEKPYAFFSGGFDLPSEPSGFYVLMASDSPEFSSGASLLSAAVINYTDSMLVGSSAILGRPADFLTSYSVKPAEVARFYAMRGEDGAPQSGTASLSFATGGKSSITETAPDKNGVIGALTDLELNETYNYGSHEVLLNTGKTTAVSDAVHFGCTSPQSVRLIIDTDRPIYRPGQKIKYRLSVLSFGPDGYYPFQGSEPVKFTVTDPSGRKVVSSSEKTGTFGSFAGEVAVPEKSQLGAFGFSAEISVHDRRYYAYKSVSVEEYKRPDFELKTNENGAWFIYGKPAAIKGRAVYYFGGPVGGADISYKIYRRSFYIFPFMRFWPARERRLFAEGSIKSGADGNFSIEFKPEPEDKDFLPADFGAELSARDSGGRTITQTINLRCASASFAIKADLPGFFDEGAVSLAVKTETPDGEPVNAAVAYVLYEVSLSSAIRTSACTEANSCFAGLPDGKIMASGKLPKSGILRPALKEGVYRLRLKAEANGEKTEQPFTFIVAGDGKKLSAGFLSVTIFQRDKYEVGETARVLAGASAVQANLRYEVTAGQFLLDKNLSPRGGVKVFDIPVTRDMRGGFSFGWFGVRNFHFYGASALAPVSWSDRKLAVSLKHKAVVLPGGKADFSLNLSGKKINAAGLVRIYDRSLEYYGRDDSPWKTITDITNGGSVYFAEPRGGYPYIFPVTTGAIKKMQGLLYPRTDAVSLPALRMNSALLVRARRGGMMLGNAIGIMEDAAMPMDKAAFASAGGGAPVAAPAPAPRTDFSETAYFNPDLRIMRGTARWSVKMPERLTSWRVGGFVMSADGKSAFFEDELATAKELMARLDLPRFVRVGDKVTVKALVHNESKNALDVTAELAVRQLMSGGASSVTRQSAKVRVASGGVYTLPVELEADPAASGYEFTASVSGGGMSDSEAAKIAVLPSAETFVNSTFAALSGDARERLSLAPAANGYDAVYFRAEPQLALSVLNAIPYLVRYPHECAEQLVNKVVPLAAVSSVYAKYPALASAAKNLPPRDSAAPAMAETDPLRLAALDESPWRAAEYEPDLLNLLNPANANVLREKYMKQLFAMQTAGGGFPWFAGGQPDFYMTLYVLSGLARARQYGLPAPENVVARACAYTVREAGIKRGLAQDDISYKLFAAYVFASLDRRQYRSQVKNWLADCVKYKRAMLPAGKAQAAVVYKWLGDIKNAEAFMDAALEHAKTDPVTGVYFAPEQKAWLWYNDSIENHAFILETLTALNPRDSRIDGLARWLLMNRKTTQWKSTKASAQAVYALLAVMQARGALDKPEKYALATAGRKMSFSYAAGDLGKPMHFRFKESDFSAGQPVVTVRKQGPGTGFVSLSGIYRADRPLASSGGLLSVARKYYVVGAKNVLHPLADGESLKVGDEVRVKITITARAQFEYVYLKDPRPAGFEAENLQSGWRWDGVPYYLEPRDALTNFFFSFLPQGTAEISYSMRPAKSGSFKAGATVLQSLYSPEFSAYGEPRSIVVEK